MGRGAMAALTRPGWAYHQEGRGRHPPAGINLAALHGPSCCHAANPALGIEPGGQDSQARSNLVTVPASCHIAVARQQWAQDAKPPATPWHWLAGEREGSPRGRPI